MSSITFVVPVGDKEVYEKCFSSSPLFKDSDDFQIIPQHGFSSSGEAFNDAIEKAVNDIIVFVHQDVVFPAAWAQEFLAELQHLESSCSTVGVIGCLGMITRTGQPAGHIYRHDREVFHPLLPAEVETLDEMVICFRKSSGLRFDTALPSFFYYAVDICLQANARGLKNFAVDAPCFHQATYRKVFRKVFYESQKYMLSKWKARLPVKTPSGVLDEEKFNIIQFIKRYIYLIIGYSPPPWWEKYPVINPDDILYTKTGLTEQRTSGK